MNTKKVLTATLLLLFVFLPRLPAQELLSVRGDNNYPPYEYRGDEGLPHGFNVDIIRAVAKQMGLTIEIDLGPWNEVRGQLERGEIDLLMGMFNTPERDKLVDFSIPHFIASYAVFVPQGSEIESIGDASGKSILVQEGDLGHDYVVENNISESIRLFENLGLVLTALSEGKGDCAVISRLQGLQIIKDQNIKNLKAVGPPIIQRKYCLAVAEGNSSLLAQLNEGLSIIKTSGEYDRIYDKWFGVYELRDITIKDVATYILVIAGPLLLVILSIIIWSWSLRRQVRLRTEELSEANMELTRHKDNLEELIRERTIDLEEARDAAEAASRAKSTFLANMSHEIRTPMNAVLGFSEILLNKEKDLKKKYYLNSIYKSGSALLSLIDDILDLSKVEAGKFKLEYASFSIRELITEMHSIFSRALREKDVDLLIEIDESLPEAVILDETRLRQVLINLVGNAVKFTEKGFIKINARRGARAGSERALVNLAISVEDTGVGIPEDQVDRIFQAFTQVKGQKTSHYGGTGLGLSITQRMVELMGGHIELKSEYGKGSRFEVILEDVEVGSPSSLKKSNGNAGIPRVLFHRGRVLVADDIEFNRELIKGYLSEYNLEIIEAENGFEVMARIEESIPDLLLLDMKMPDMDGYEVLRELKKKREFDKIAIIAVTASALKDDEEKIKRITHSYLRKPLKRDVLITELMRFLPHSEEGSYEPEAAAESEKAVEPVAAEVLERIQAILRSEIDQLNEIVDIMAIDRIERFAERMQELGETENYTPLKEWAAKMSDAAVLFSIDAIREMQQKLRAMADTDVER